MTFLASGREGENSNADNPDLNSPTSVLPEGEEQDDIIDIKPRQYPNADNFTI